MGSPLWPVRYKPLPDELLSSWLVRLAHGHGLKVQTFCNLIFGNQRQLWNRDIDRLAPPWLVETLAERTATPLQQAWMTTLRVFDGALCRFRSSGELQWIQTLQMYHRTREGYGQQFCPVCLSTDEMAYFRKSWRTAIKTMCLAHECMLVDRCIACTAAVSFHRTDMGKGPWNENASMRLCYACGFDLAGTPAATPPWHDCPEALSVLCWLVGEVDKLSVGTPSEIHISFADVLHQWVAMMVSRKPAIQLNAYIADHIGAEPIQVPGTKRVSIEGLPNSQRHQLLLQAAWLLLDPLNRIRQAWRDKAIRYNHLVRDFDHIPAWYQRAVVDQIARRPYTHRTRLSHIG